MFKSKSPISLGLLLLFALYLSSCGQPLPLKNADEKINNMVYAMAEYCHGDNVETENITNKILEFKTLADEIYNGELTPNSDTSRYNLIDEGLQIQPYPEGNSVAGATVWTPFDIPLGTFIEVLVSDDWENIYVDPDRYIYYTRAYTVGDKDEFIAGTTDWLVTENWQEDIGQRGIQFEYQTRMTFRRVKDEGLPESGVLVICNEMLDEAQNTTGELNARMQQLFSFNIYFPVSESRTYKINATWLQASGGLWIFSAGANSGNVGEGILDEQTSLVNYINANY